MLRIKFYVFSMLIALTLVNCGGGGSDSEPETSLDSISINSPPQNLKLTETFQLIATGTLSDASNLGISSQVTWLSSNEAIMTVSNSGLIRAVSAGTASISATLNTVSGNISALAIALAEISITPSSLTLAIASTQQLTATARYTDNSTENLTNSVTWGSNTSAVASITSSGNLTAIAAGTSEITATINGVTGMISVAVPVPVPVPRLDSISINSPSQNLKLADTFQLIATGTFSDASSSDISNQVTWLSSNEAIMTVSNSGLIRAVSAGTASISATLNTVSGNISALAIALAEISITPSSLTLAIASTQQLTATARYTDNSTEDLTSSASWSTDSVNATITSSGNLTADSVGTSQVTASVNSVSGVISVIISAATLQKIDIVASSSLAAGVSEQLSAIGTFSDGSTQNITADLSWQSSIPSVASIGDQTALLTTIQQGSVVITATNGELTDTKNVTISLAILSKLSIVPSAISLAKGSTKEVTVTAFYSDQSFIDVSNQVTWLSSDNTITTVQDGTALVEGHEVGSSILTAAFSGMNATLNVNVTSATLSSLNISPKNTSIPNGLNQAFSVTGIYSDGSVQNLTHQVTWISSDNSLGSISNAENSQGIADAIAIGSVTITASLEAVSTSTTLTINNAQLASIEITPSQTQVANGVSVQVSALGTYSDGTQIDITQLVQWDSNKVTVAKASSITKGLFETFNSGQALISANLNSVSALSSITVNAATLQTININSSILILPKGSEVILTAIGVYSDNSNNDMSHQVTWTSSDDNILTVENIINTQSVVGLTKATNIGGATVTASFNGVVGNIALTVSDAMLTQIAISSENTDININSNTQALAMATFSDASTLDMTQQVNWLSSNSLVASVNQFHDNGGLVKGVVEGSFQLSASFNGIASNALTINVNSTPNAPRSMTFNLTPNVILSDNLDSSQIEVTLIPESESGVILDGTSVSFDITEDGNTRTETAVTVNGVATLNLTSLIDGFILIKASFNNDISAESIIVSTSRFSDVIIAEGRSDAVFTNNMLIEGSVFYVLLRNISNREFNIPAVFITRGPDGAQVNLHDSPVTDLQFTNGGVLPGGAFTALGYSLDDDIPGNTLRMIYNFTDTATELSFFYGIAFSY